MSRDHIRTELVLAPFFRYILSLFCARMLQVGSAGYSVKLQEQERLRMMFSFLPFKGKVRLRNPQHRFQVRAPLFALTVGL